MSVIYVGKHGSNFLLNGCITRAERASRVVAAMLNIVGSAHEAYYDAYMNLMHDVELVDTEVVLK